eukprot:7733274-Lingulodinium_polyedra.AAC.1
MQDLSRPRQGRAPSRKRGCLFVFVNGVWQRGVVPARPRTRSPALPRVRIPRDIADVARARPY